MTSRSRIAELTGGLIVIVTFSPVAQQGEEQTIASWLARYDAALNAKNLDKLATFYHPDATIGEWPARNNSWADYRDHHLGPEMKKFEGLQFVHSNTKVHMLGDCAAYVTCSTRSRRR